MKQSSGTSHQVSLEEAMSIAILFQKNGQLNEAEEVYRRLRDVLPDHPAVLHYSGVLAQQQGRSAQAVELLEKSLALEPDQADCYSNLGIIFKAKGKLEKAVAVYQRAIEISPEHVNAHCNLGVILKAQGKLDEAEAAYRTAIRLNPEHIESYHNLGVLLVARNRTREAVTCFCKVTTLSPKHPEARRLLALAHCALGEVDKAVEIFEGWLAEEPDNPVARHMLAACSREDVPTRASDAYVEKIFDDFASSFDTKLAKLSYRAPSLVEAVLADAGAEAAKRLAVLDAGCGTGLCGPLIAPYARHMVGIDLSAQMLARAKERDVYDELVKGELTAYLRDATEAFDLIVSADTLVYFGALEEVLAAAAGALRAGGLLIFTLEEDAEDAEVAESSAAIGYTIETHGRYAHTGAYVERSLRNAGLEFMMVRAELRMESGSPVSGLVVRGTKPAGVSHG